MLIIKEGATDSDQRVVAACVDFLTPSIVHEVNFEMTKSKLRDCIKEKKQEQQQKRKGDISFIHNNKSRRNSEVVFEDDEEAKQADIGRQGS